MESGFNQTCDSIGEFRMKKRFELRTGDECVDDRARSNA